MFVGERFLITLEISTKMDTKKAETRACKKEITFRKECKHLVKLCLLLHEFLQEFSSLECTFIKNNICMF